MKRKDKNVSINIQLEDIMRGKNPFIIVTKKVKYLGINSTRNVQNI